MRARPAADLLRRELEGAPALAPPSLCHATDKHAAPESPSPHSRPGLSKKHAARPTADLLRRELEGARLVALGGPRVLEGGGESGLGDACRRL